MSPNERRKELLEVLCLKRHATCEILAREFHVCERTIRYDIKALMCEYPIETVCGRYGGGVKVAEGFYLNRRHEQKVLTPRQTELLRKMSKQLDGDDLDTLNSILTPPTH